MTTWRTENRSKTTFHFVFITVILMTAYNMRLTDICAAVSLPATPSSRTSPSSIRCTMGSTAAQMHAGKTAWGGCSMWWVGVCSVVFSSSDRGGEK